MKLTALILAVCLVAGCESGPWPLDPGAEKVMVTGNPQLVRGAELLGTGAVQADFSRPVMDTLHAQARNYTHRLGGNIALLSNTQTLGYYRNYVTATVEAYRRPEGKIRQ